MGKKIKNLVAAASDHLSACLSPLIPVITAGSLMKLFCLIMNMTGILPENTQAILEIIGDTPFYFLPVLVSVTAAQHFGANLFYSVGSACMLLMPDFAALLESSEKVTFFALPVVKTNYAYNILPVILLVWLLSRLEPAAGKRFPKALKGTIYPFLVFTASAVCGFLVVGPIGALISGALSDGLSFLSVHAGVAAWALFAALTPLLVPAGMHWIFVTTAITDMASKGYDAGIMAAFFILSMTLAGADFAVTLRTKDPELKGQALSAGIAVMLSGVSEPSLFGVCLREKKALKCVMLSCALAGVYQGIVGVRCYVYSFPAVCSILMFHGPDGAGNLWEAVILGAISIVLSFVLTFIALGRKTPAQEA